MNQNFENPTPFRLLMAQIETMRDRSRQYAEEEEAEGAFESAEKHRSCEGALNELLRLGNYFNEPNTSTMAPT